MTYIVCIDNILYVDILAHKFVFCPENYENMSTSNVTKN